MEQPSLWDRLRRARIVQVLAVYLGASWVVLQIAEVLVEALALPDWVLPVTLILLLVGMVVILATAWIQSMPSTTAGEDTGELPTDWEIAPADAVSSLMKGRLPHLTWGRALLGGVVALSLLFGGTGLYFGFSGGPVAIGPTEAGASEAAEGIAVVPFDVRGDEELEIWREGMMDLLANNLDGVGGFRTIDARTVMARWHEQVGDKPQPDLTDALRVAASTGARYALEGSVVGLGDNVRLVTNVYDLSSREEVAQAVAEGPATDVLRLVDQLAVATIRDLLASTGRAGAGDLNAETLTTSSLPALRAFLEGESHYRKSRFAEAVQSFERAVAEDTTFSIALVRLSEAYGWLEDQSSEKMREYGERAMAHADQLSPRYRFILEGWHALQRLSPAGLPSLKQAVQKYPDDPEAWFLLAETYIHVGPATYGTEDELWEAIQKAVELDPSFAPYRVHQAQWAVLRGDRELAEETLDKYEQLTGSRDGLEGIEIAIPLLLGDSAEAATATDMARSAPERTLLLYHGTFARRHDRFDRELFLEDVLEEHLEVNRDPYIAYNLSSMGELQKGATLAANGTVPPADRGIYWGQAQILWDVGPPGSDDPGGELELAACDVDGFRSTCHLFLGLAFLDWGQDAEHRRAIQRLREEAGVLGGDDPEAAEGHEAGADVLEGSGLRQRGNTAQGRQLLERHIERTDLVGEQARLEMARLEADEGRPAQALRHFRTALHGYFRPLALYGIARMHEELGQHDEAREHWESLVTLTRTGDDLPRIREAREAVRE